jgi:CheY-like chemotaxis protein
MEAVGQLTGGLAHDFNNLLMVTIGNLDLLADDLRDFPKQRSLAETALAGALRGAELTRQLLAFSRRQTLQPKVVQINDFISGMTKLLQRTLGETIEVRMNLAADLWSANVDPSQVESALMNLAVNARDAMPSGGRLTIETTNKHLDEDYVALNPEAVPGDYVMLAVSDTGSGIPREILERVFEPFFTTKETGKGTGLGLSMVYGFIKQSGGHIKIYSEVDVGTSVRLYLPRAIKPDEEKAVGTPMGDAFMGRGETILVVDDNAEVRRTAVAQLERLGYRVREAADGPEAIAVLREIGRVDLLFTDVVMAGGMSGLDLAAQARATRPDLKVLFTSGFAENARNGGNFRETDDFLSKPYRRQELAEKVRGILGQRG